MFIKHMFGAWYDFGAYGCIDLSHIRHFTKTYVSTSEDQTRGHWYCYLHGESFADKIEIQGTFKAIGEARAESETFTAELRAAMKNVHGGGATEKDTPTRREPNNLDIEVS